MGEQLCGPQHQGRTCSVVRSLPEGGDRGSRAAECTAKAYGRGEEPEIAAAKNPPAYGAWNVQKSDDGNWGGPPRPGDLRVRHRKVGSYNRFRREVDSCRVGVARRP